MDFDDAKENIQPLATGRNASILQASLRAESPQELMAQRKELEECIHNYKGDDPLEPWYTYVSWIEQSFPSGGKESGLDDVLTKCLSRFENEERYYQDRRMVKLYIKFIDSYKEPTECYQQLFNAGIGTMVADFYICWAYYYDLSGNTRKADEIFKRGIACRAQPLDELQEAHQHFGFSVAQRIMYKDDEDAKEDANRQLQERRIALTSLRGQRRKAAVGSIRTGAVVKSYTPGTVKTEASGSCRQNNERVQVIKDENQNPNSQPIFTSATAAVAAVAVDNATSEQQPHARGDANKSVVRSIIDKARDQENIKEPGPWNKAHDKKYAGKLFSKTKRTHELSFNIHEDDVKTQNESYFGKALKSPITDGERKYDKTFKYSENFVSKNKPQAEWATPVTIDNEPKARVYPLYNKCMIYPRPNMEFQLEELKAYNFFKMRGITNAFTKLRDSVWSKYDINANVRQYPNFANESKVECLEPLDVYYAPENREPLIVAYKEIYDAELKEEFQLEELILKRLKRNCTINKSTDMEETMCTASERMQRRKSFFPLRKSMAAKTMARNIIIPAENVMEDQQSEADDKENIEKVCSPPTLPQETNNENEVFPKKTELPFAVYEDTIQLPSTSKAAAVGAMSLKQLDVPATKCFEAAKSTKAFEIFEDSIKPANDNENDFQFKPPAAPTSMRPANLPFEIYTETSPPTAAREAGGGFFDGEETCSTQTFNIFLLKSQSVSTPKVPQKVAPRQFGNILKDVPVMQIEEQTVSPSSASTQANTSENDVGAAAAVNSIIATYSPARNKQLSTILETSEHGTTQGTTHTTGTSTKSTINSPEYDAEVNTVGVTTTTTTRVTMPHTELETLEEHSRETSTTSSTKVEELMKSMNLQNNQKHAAGAAAGAEVEMSLPAKSKSEQQNLAVPATPADVRLQTGAGINFAIFEDTIETFGSKHQVGNFTRLEEREDTAAGYSVRTVRFQEDKTETISKMFLAPHQDIKFPDDKTETISKMLLAATALPIPVKFEDEKATESIAKIQFQPPNLAPTAHEPINIEDSFQFFAQTPPKSDKTLFGIQKLKQQQAHTPLESFSKRFCDKDTPDIAQAKSASSHNSKASKPLPLFEDELEAHNLLKTNKKLMDSFSVVQTTQHSPVKPKIKINFADSFIPDFSLDEEMPPAPSNLSVIPDSQPCNSRTGGGGALRASPQPQQRSTIFSNLSVIPDSQPCTSRTGAKLASTQLDDKSSIASTSVGQQKLDDSFLPEISMVLDSQPMESANKWKAENKTTTQNPIPLESFIKEFSIINEPPKELVNNLTATQQSTKTNVTLKFLNESKINNKTATSPTRAKHNLSQAEVPGSTVKFLKNTTTNMPQTAQYKLSFLNLTKDMTPPGAAAAATDLKSNKIHQSGNEQFFELNCETEMFSTNISMIKNSTFLPSKQKQLQHHQQVLPSLHHHQSQIQEQSLHIKEEQVASPMVHSKNLETSYMIFKSPPLVAPALDSSKPQTAKLSFLGGVSNKSRINVESTSAVEPQKNASSLENSTQKQNLANARTKTIAGAELKQPQTIKDDDDDDYGEMSIYFKHTPKSPKIKIHTWHDDDSPKTPIVHEYKHALVDLNQTNQLIEDICVDPNLNPFNTDLINAFLDQIDFSNYISDLPTCKLVGHVSRIKLDSVIKVNATTFKIAKLIGEGAYGIVFCGTELSSGKKYALKQERPPNYWEYYICLEVRSRLKAEEMFPAFLNFEYALIGHNSSILISAFSQYGSLITVCNKIKKRTTKNVDEFVVMLLTCELLEIIDHLHAANIIHTDIKPDNFLLMRTLKYPSVERALQLIDFGVSIDMQMFKPGQTFSYINKDDSFKCIEMREKRQWTYQLDLFGLASVIHVLLFGKYMVVEQRPNGVWMHKTYMPRYLHKMLWENIFKTLLNIRDCNSMPNLQQLRAELKEELAENEKSLVQKIAEFNMALRI